MTDTSDQNSSQKETQGTTTRKASFLKMWIAFGLAVITFLSESLFYEMLAGGAHFGNRAANAKGTWCIIIVIFVFIGCVFGLLTVIRRNKMQSNTALSDSETTDAFNKLDKNYCTKCNYLAKDNSDGKCPKCGRHLTTII